MGADDMTIFHEGKKSMQARITLSFRVRDTRTGKKCMVWKSRNGVVDLPK